MKDRLKVLFAELTGKNRFDREDFVILKTMPMLAAVDGDYSEIARASITVLSQKVKATRGKLLDERYPHAAKFDRN